MTETAKTKSVFPMPSLAVSEEVFFCEFGLGEELKCSS